MRKSMIAIIAVAAVVGRELILIRQLNKVIWPVGKVVERDDGEMVCPVCDTIVDYMACGWSEDAMPEECRDRFCSTCGIELIREDD